jgi:hypothetical protein
MKTIPTITSQQLSNANSCFAAIKVFRTIFEDKSETGVELTLDNLLLFEQEYKKKHNNQLPYAIMCFLLKSLSEEIKDRYCDNQLFNNGCRYCPLNEDNEDNITEDRFNTLLLILKENGKV